MSQIIPDLAIQSYLRGTGIGEAQRSARAEEQFRRDAAAQQAEQFAGRMALDRDELGFRREQAAGADARWSADFMRALDQDALAQERFQADQMAAEQEGEAIRQINRTLVGRRPDPSMLVPEEPDPLQPLVESAPWQAQGVLHKYLSSAAMRRKALAVLDEIHAGRLSPNSLADPDDRMLAQLAIEANNIPAALNAMERMRAQAEAEKQKQGMAEILATRPGPDGKPAVDPVLMQNYMRLPLSDVQSDFQLALGQQAGIRRGPAGDGGAMPAPEEIAFFRDALSKTYPKADPEVLAGAAAMLAANKPVDRPEIAVGESSQTPRYTAGEIKALEAEAERASKRVDRIEKLRDYNGKLSAEDQARYDQAVKDEDAAFERLQTARRGQPIDGGAVTTAPPNAPAAPGATPTTGAAKPPAQIDDAVLRQAGQQARAEFIRVEGRNPATRNGKIVPEDVAKLKSLMDRILASASAADGRDARP